MNLKKILKNKKALLHYNISTFEQLKAGIEAVKESNIPIIFGFSEGEIDYIGIEIIKKFLNFIREKKLPIFFNGDHIKDFNLVKRLVDLDFDSVLFDNSGLDFKENILRTKKIVEYKDKKNRDILIEGELGYIGGGSDVKIFELKDEYLTDKERAREFVKKTGVDLLAISVGNIHGIPKIIKYKGRIYKRAILDFKRIKEIKENIEIPLVLHGGSGLRKNDYKRAIENGISIIHINTEFRRIWKKELERNLKRDTVVPYKILKNVIEKIKKDIIEYQRLFWNNTD
ncbi:MAG: class II fructose-bisphosphate aldolase [Minisyncoccia bacterium]